MFEWLHHPEHNHTAVAIYVLIGGMLNRWRGGWGWFNDRFEWGAKGARQIVSLYLIAPIAYALYLEFGESEQIKNLIHAALLWLLMWGSFVSGWGLWFDMQWQQSINPNYDGNWMDDEVGWIDWALYKLLGPKWIPKNWSQYGISKDDYYRLKSDYNKIDSPTGGVRPYKWNLAYDFLGMSLRGLHFTVPIAIYLGYFFNPLLFWFAPMGLAMGIIYYISWYHLPEIRSKTFPLFHTHMAEFVWGLYISALMACFAFLMF